MSLAKKNEIFSIADTKTCWVFWGFEQLFGVISGGVILAQRHMQNCWI